MTQSQRILGTVALAFSSVFAGPVFAQMTMDHGKMAMPAMPAMPALTDGEVRKIDKETGKITLRHGEIKHLEMPPMTMVFVARDKTLLDAVQPGDKVRFMVAHDNGQMVVTDIRPAK